MGYPGGKAGGGVYQAIINQMPPHETYIEAFLGGAAVMRHKLPARVNIGIDIDPAIAGTGDASEPIAASWPRDARWDELVVHCGDALDWLATRKWTGRELVYADPPYLARSRNWPKRACYAFEMGADEQHRRLLAVLKRLPCLVMISGYASMLYIAELGDWRLVDFTAPTRGKPATEQLWCNFPAPRALHDPRYIGADYRERERIRKKARRWAANLAELDPLERQAVLSACLAGAA